MNALARTLPLPALPAPVTTPVDTSLRRKRKQTWLALHFADWPLHAAMHTLTRERRASLAQQPLAVLDQDRQRRVLVANPEALAQGVRPGHALNAALALCAQLQLLPRDAVAETRLLAELATWAQRYTPLVCMEAPNELLLEVRGSLRLFGGVAALLEQVRQALQQRQLVASMALSPTARASLCLARCQRSQRIESATVVIPMQLKTALSSLPLGCLRWPVEIEVRLARFGITRLGELWRLPRADLARRIGVRYLRELDALLGRQVELRRPFRTIPIYRDHMVLDFEISSTPLLEQVLSSALHRLQRYLREHDLALGRVFIELRHREHEATRLCVGLATPTSEMQRVAALLHEQLNHLVLPAPVLELRLCVKQLLAAQGIASDLLAGVTQGRPAQLQTEMLGRLLERLQVRLGKTAIRSLQLRADHRPECAQTTQPASLQVSGRQSLNDFTVHHEPVEGLFNKPSPVRFEDRRPSPWGRLNANGNRNVLGVQFPMQKPVRPLWLLSEPMVISDGTRPPRELQLIQGPERIEAGWWSDAPLKRDYYVARHGNQSCCWVFKDLLQASGWYVHGWFG